MASLLNLPPTQQAIDTVRASNPPGITSQIEIFFNFRRNYRAKKNWIAPFGHPTPSRIQPVPGHRFFAGCYDSWDHCQVHLLTKVQKSKVSKKNFGFNFVNGNWCEISTFEFQKNTLSAVPIEAAVLKNFIIFLKKKCSFYRQVKKKLAKKLNL